MGRTKNARKLARTIATCTTLFLSQSKTAYAGINVKDASFSTTFVDLDTGHLKITRTYDSRSTHIGLFGFGWCSNLDRRLLKNTQTPQLAIENCGRRTVFEANRETKPTQKWISSDPRNGSIEIDRGDFVHRDWNGRVIARYGGPDGALSALADDRGQEVPLLRGARRSLLRDAASGEGLKVRLEVDPLADKILAIETSDGSSRATFHYLDDDLVKATNAWNNTYHFRYDSLHNLLEASYPDRTSEQMTYDADRDHLMSFKGRNGCTERYAIEVDQPQVDHRTQKTIATKSCSEKETSRVSFEFDYRKSRGPAGKWRLAKIKLDRGGGKTNEIRYDKNGGAQ